MENNFDSSGIYCRLCLCKLESQKEAKLIIKNEVKSKKGLQITGGYTLLNKIRAIIPIEIHKSDGYSMLICTFCDTRIDEIDEFVVSVVKNQKQLRKFGIKIPTSSCKGLDSEICFEPEILIKPEEVTVESLDEPIWDDDTDDNNEDWSIEGSGTKKTDDSRIADLLFCELCSNKPKFFTFTNLKSHYDITHSIRGYASCCKKKFYDRKTLVAHLECHQDPSQFTCNECLKIFTSKTSLKAHTLKQHSTIIEETCKKNITSPTERQDIVSIKHYFVCHECPKEITFDTFKDLKEHFMKKHDMEAYVKCCGKKFRHIQGIYNHNKTHIQEPFTCDICSKKYRFKKYLIEHIYCHISDVKPEIQCTDCTLKFYTAEGLKMHGMAHGKEPKLTEIQERNANALAPYLICELCEPSPSFKRYKEMIGHYLNDHDTKGYIRCCGKQFFTRKSALIHTNIHLRPTEFMCKICNKILPDKKTLQNHMDRHRPDEEKNFECEICGKRFHVQYDVIIHKRSNHEQRDIIKPKCLECNKEYSSKLSLYLHKRRFHMGLAMPICDTCGFMCRSNADLRSHIRARHTEIEKIKCDLCEHYVKDMKKHMQIHYEQTLDIKCDICGHKTTTFKYLKLHMKIHTDEKPFTCTTCGMSFRRKENLEDHNSVHTGVPRHKCKYCDRTFNNSGNKFKHIKAAHPLEQAQDRKKPMRGKVT